MPLLGIGLPVRNGERHLAATIESLRRQEFTDFEVLILDNASTDRTGEIARAAAGTDQRFRYLRHERNIGVEHNFNAAFSRGSADLHMWAANDLYHPGYLRRCVEALEQRPDAVAATTAAALIDADGNPIPELVDEPVRTDHPDRLVRFADFASHRHACLAMYAVMRREAVARTGLLGAYWGSDRLFLAELALSGPVLRHPEPLFYNRWHPSLSAAELGHQRLAAPTIHYARELARVLRGHRVPVSQRGRVIARWCWENRLRLLRSAGRGMLIAIRRSDRPGTVPAEAGQ